MPMSDKTNWNETSGEPKAKPDFGSTIDLRPLARLAKQAADYGKALDEIRMELNRSIATPSPDPAVMFDVLLEINGKLGAVGK